jgi:hypothetical protein
MSPIQLQLSGWEVRSLGGDEGERGRNGGDWTGRKESARPMENGRINADTGKIAKIPKWEAAGGDGALAAFLTILDSEPITILRTP